MSATGGIAQAVTSAGNGEGAHEGPALVLRNLRKLFGSVVATDDVDLEVPHGEFLTLLGPSGSGKTTTLRMIAGFTTPSGGTIEIDGSDMTRVAPHRRNVGMVFQNYALFPHMTASENIAFPLQMRGVSRGTIRKRVDEALRLVKLETFGNRLPRELSGGQQQRIALARAVVFRPCLLLMDEPLGALDRKLREALQLEIMRVGRDLGASILYVTHDQEEALLMSDRIAIFNKGRIEQLGSGEDLDDQPATLFVAEFIGESNIIRGRFERDGGAAGWVVREPWRCQVGPSSVERASLDRGAAVGSGRSTAPDEDSRANGGGATECNRRGRDRRRGALPGCGPEVRAAPRGRAARDRARAARRNRAGLGAR